MRIVGKSSDFDVSPQEMTAFGDGNWSGESHLWGRPSKAGEWADLELPVRADGRYHVLVYLTKARDYGIVRFDLDGKPLGKAIDCFHANNVVSTGAIDLGTVDLKKGTSDLRGRGRRHQSEIRRTALHVGVGLRGPQAGGSPRFGHLRFSERGSDDDLGAGQSSAWQR